ncbi:hypothetical protein MW887_005820 [Aspergillus wentii]|nr:hypothetical protein MW887_005820 [Aspergillus wentii]
MGSIGITHDPPEPIAVIGMGCRFPGEASSLAGFWEMLRHGRSGNGRVPERSYNPDAFYHPNNDRKGAINHTDGFFLEEDVSLFDAPFFSITAKEAAGMDPVQRLLLEVAYETFENAGIPIDQLPGSMTSVYSGCMTNDYELLSTRDIHNMPHNSATGNGRTMLANRISWFYDLRGPSIMLDTACSSSLSALHLACQSLRLRESKMALITGSSLILHPNFTQRLSYMRMLSPDGISHSFDERANGYGRGEGIGAMIVKPLRDALADGDNIRAVIRGTGSNQDGRTPGITMPNGDSQADLIRRVYAETGLAMKDTSYFEAHGTGTKIGDPTELEALGTTFGLDRDPEDGPMYVGSVKTNIGHTEGAAGIAAMIKVVLKLEKDKFVPNAGFKKLNPKIKLDEWKLRLTNDYMQWPPSLSRRASVNSFGFGGANAHVIVESAAQFLSGLKNNIIALPSADTEVQIPEQTEKAKKLLVYSTQDKNGIARLGESWNNFLQNKPDEPENPDFLDDLAYTLAIRRSVFGYRSFAVADSIVELKSSVESGLPTFPRAGRNNRILFVFTGQGGQWAGMGRQLLKQPVFATSMARTQAVLQKLGCAWDIRDEIQKTDNPQINTPEFSQPVCTALQIALVDLLASWDIHPKGTVGHSSGEMGAAYGAGYLSHEDAIAIAYSRGICSSQVRPRLSKDGAMMAAGLSADEAQAYLKKVPEGSAVVACINSPSSVTLSGDDDAITTLESLIQEDKKFARKLRVDTAYHSPQIAVVAEDMRRSIQDVKPQTPADASVTMFSSLNKKVVKPDDLIPEYWFEGAVTSAFNHTEAGKVRRRARVNWSCAVEIGPHEVLKGPLLQTVEKIDKNMAKIAYLTAVKRNQDAEVTALALAGSLWSTGHPVNLSKINGIDDRETRPQVVVDLPSYPWNHRSSFWHEPRDTKTLRTRAVPRHDFLGVPIDFQNDLEPRWSHYMRVSENPWIADHVVAGSILYPAAGMVVMAAEAARQLADPSQKVAGIELQDLQFYRGVIVPGDDQGLETAIHLSPHKSLPGWFEFGIFSLPPDGSWTKHSEGILSVRYTNPTDAEHWKKEAIKARHTQSKSTDVPMDDVYNWLSNIGVELGPSFHSITRTAFSNEPSSTWGSVVATDTKENMPHGYQSDYLIHPTTLDSLFQSAVLSVSEKLQEKKGHIPVAAQRIFIPTGIPVETGSSFDFHIQTRKESGEVRSKCITSDPEWSAPGIVMEGVLLGEIPMASSAAGQGGDGGAVQKCSTITWEEDVASAEAIVGSLSTDDKGIDSALRDWMASLCHNNGDLSVLFLTDELVSHDINAIKQFGPSSVHRPRFQQLSIAVPSSAVEATKETLAEVEPPATVWEIDYSLPLSKEAVGDTTYDLVLLDTSKLGANAAQVKLDFAASLVDEEGWFIGVLPRSSLPWSPILTDLELNRQSLHLESSNSEAFIAQKDSIIVDVDPEVYVLTRNEDKSQNKLLDKLSAYLSSHGTSLKISTLDDVGDLQGRTVISLLEADSPWVSQWNEREYQAFQSLVHSATYILWVSREHDQGPEINVEFGATTGLLRTIRSEIPGLTMPHLTINWATPLDHASIASSIYKVLKRTIVSGKREVETEFRLEDEKLLIPRVVETPGVEKDVRVQIDGPRPVLGSLSEDDRPLKLSIDSSSLDEASWIHDVELEQPLPSDSVDVQIDAVAVTDHDINTLKNQKSQFGRQASGTVIQIGSTVSGLRPGDRVVVLSAGDSLLRTHARLSSSAVCKVPRIVDSTMAAILPTAYATAYHALFELAKVDKTNRILIAGCTDAALGAVQLASATGIEVFLAVESEDDRSILIEKYNVPADNIFDFADGSLADDVLDRTDRKGVDAVISTVSGLQCRAAAASLANFGKSIDLSGHLRPSGLPQTFISRGCSLQVFDLEQMLSFKPDAVYQAMRETLHLIDVIKPPLYHPYSTFPVSDIKEAVVAKQGGHRGPVILDLRADGAVRIIPRPPPTASLDPEATYVLSGGLGSLGLSFAETLIEVGARHIVFLSRSGAIHDWQKDALQGLSKDGCTAQAITCDVSKTADVLNFIGLSLANNWKIKGVIQCTMVLRDNMFEKMTYTDWTESTASKIQGSWNLHRLLPQNLDFFITLSSVASVIGNIAQANYSAGNGFMDALTTYRRKKNLAGTTINIGLVTDGGAVTEVRSEKEREEKYRNLTGTTISKNELQVILKVILKGKTASGDIIPPQVIAGIADNLARDGYITTSWQLDRKFDHRIKSAAAENGKDGKDGISKMISESENIADATKVVEQGLKEYVAAAMTASADSIDTERPLNALGVDSLKAVELQGWVLREMKSEISSFDILSSMPMSRLSEKIAEASSAVKA